MRKLLSTEHDQRVQEVGLSLLGPAAAIDEGDATAWISGFLGNRALSIAGGTSDVQRNIVAERLLGLATRRLTDRPAPSVLTRPGA